MIEGVLEFEFQLVVVVEIFQFDFGGDDQFDVVVVEFIYQVDEMLCYVVFGDVYLFDVGDQYGVENFCQFDVVVLVVWVVVQFMEFELGYVVVGQVCVDFVVFDYQCFVVLGFGIVWGQGFEVVCYFFFDLFVEWLVEQFGLFQCVQVIVDVVIDVDDFGMFFEQGDCWQEMGVLQVVFVQVVWYDVGGCYQVYVVFEQFFQQGGEDYCVGDVGDEEFVEVDYLCFVGEVFVDDGQWVFFVFEGFQFFVYLFYEVVEVCVYFLFEWQ